MKVLVCGGRDYCEVEHLNYTLDQITNPYHGGKWSFELVCGMADGADTLAYNWAQKHGLTVHKFPADWEKYGKRAGYIRNQQMLDEGKPDLVIAFPGGKGTAMMVNLARKAGVEVIEVTDIQHRSERADT